MTDTSEAPGLPPVAPMSLPARLRTLREFHTGPAFVRDLAGPVVRVHVGPQLVVPPYVLVTSPQGAEDVLAGSSNDTMDKLTQVHLETRLMGDNVFNLPYEPWKPQRRTLQPLFTKQHVATFAGHMAAAADERAATWVDGARIDIDKDMRGLTLRVLGRSMFGVDLDEHASDLGPSIQQLLNYATSRGLRPVRAPKSLPTPARRRFRRALAEIHAVIEEAIAGYQANPALRSPGTVDARRRRRQPCVHLRMVRRGPPCPHPHSRYRSAHAWFKSPFALEQAGADRQQGSQARRDRDSEGPMGLREGPFTAARCPSATAAVSSEQSSKVEVNCVVE